MFKQNLYYTFKSRPFFAMLMVLTASVIFTVAVTAYGEISSLEQFLAAPQSVRYSVVPRETVLSGELDCGMRIPGVRAAIFSISTANVETSTVLVGVLGEDGWLPRDDIDCFVGDKAALHQLPAQTETAWLSAEYYNLYDNIDPWIEEAGIDERRYAVAGMANYYFNESSWAQLLAATEVSPLLLDLEIPPARNAYGGEVQYPLGVGTVLISGKRFSQLNIPLSSLSIVFENPISEEQYRMMKGFFDPARFEVEAYHAGGAGFSVAAISGAACALAVVLAMLMMCGLVRYLLDSQESAWRALYLIGCTKRRLLAHMMGIVLILYAGAALAAFFPSYYWLRALAEMGISMEMPPVRMAIAAVCAVLLAAVAALPACASAVKRFSREEGAYVQTL